MAKSLSTQGYFTTTNFLETFMIQRLRDQCISLRDQGRFEQSWSEKIVNGTAVRFDKEGVFACEPDGKDYDTAPDLITYMALLISSLPSSLNSQPRISGMELSTSAFNAKLAVTSPGGSVYPLHIDNPEGLSAGDTRKLTCILYLNPAYEKGDGGELQIVLSEKEINLTPEGGRLVAFWSDEIPHQVLPTAPNAAANDANYDRYALTVWIPTDNVTAIHNPHSKFKDLSEIAFP
jgi:Rps23 Pro-64 3,4-dihydroxylase Tpa1-like proline 4-hydroxylase